MPGRGGSHRPGLISVRAASVGVMLEARKASVWRNSYDITVDSRPLARWDGSSWKAGGTFELDGRRYDVRTNMWATTYVMADGVPVGSVKRNSMWRSDTVADLPLLPLPVQVFVLAVVLTVWDQAASSGAG